MKKNLATNIVVLTVLAVILVVVGVVVFGTSSEKEESPRRQAAKECEYTASEKSQVLRLFPGGSPAQDSEDGAAAFIDKNELQKLVGKCELDVLKKVHELGATTVRDLSRCWPDCMITMEFLEGRVNYAAKESRIIYLSAG